MIRKKKERNKDFRTAANTAVSVTDITSYANADLEKIPPKIMKYKQRRKRHLCFCCSEMAMKLVSYQCDGFTMVERYCNNHIDVNLKQKEKAKVLQ